MRRVFNHHRAQTTTSSAHPRTGSDINVHSPRESETRLSVISDVFARVESIFNHFQSVTHNPRARATAASAVDKEMDSITQIVRSLRNDLAPISVLPPEVLSRVFHFLSLEESPFDYPGKHNLGWIRATHVCWLWRQVALSDSFLWARISGMPTNRELVSEMIARARNAPLDIDMDFDGASNLKVLRILPPHLSHTHKLRLRGLDTQHYETVRGICSQEAPALEHFELLNSSYITFRNLGGTTLFKGRAPKLRTVSLFNVFIPWPLIPHGQLTQLEISLDNDLISGIPLHYDINQLIDLLANCPELEVLVLRSCLPSQPAHFTYGQTIHLPCLSRLCLVGSSPRVTNLLTKLKLPSSTMLQLYCSSENDSTRNHNLLLPVVEAHLQSPVPVEFRKLSVAVSGMNNWLVVTASTSLPKPRVCQLQDFESEMEEDFVLSFNGLRRKGLIERVCKILPISNLKFLSIRSTDVYGTVVGPVNWVELFKHCLEVTTMQATGRGTSSLVRDLAAPKIPKMKRNWRKKLGHDNRNSTLAQPARRTAPHAHMPIFPKLMILSLKKLDFSERKPSGILFNVVQNGLRQRKVVYRAPVEILCIDDCAISTNRAMALQRLVEKLFWDGEEGDEFDDVPESLLVLGLEDVSEGTVG